MAMSVFRGPGDRADERFSDAEGVAAVPRRRWAAAVGALALVLFTPPLAADVLEVRSTDLVLADWTRIAADDRPWFIAGFALGWHGGEAREVPRPLTQAIAAYGPVVAGLARRAAASEASSRRLLTVLLRARVAGRLPLPTVSGHDWMALIPARRLALLHGFHGGVYARAVWGRADPIADDDRLDDAFATARRDVRPSLALAPSLLFARLSDYYFYTDRRVERLVDSIAVIAAQIATP